MTKAGYDPRNVGEIANMAFVSGAQNRKISNKTPDVYFPEIIERRGIEALTKQCIPTAPELWAPERFLDFLEHRRAELAKAVNDFLDSVTTGTATTTVDLDALVDTEENDQLEFKETARYNLHSGRVDKDVELGVVKTIAAFLNTRGGTLVIGVHDATKEIRGLEPDLATLQRRDTDGFEQFLRQLFNNSYGPETSARIGIAFPAANGNQACVIRVPKSPREVYVRRDAQRDFYIRDGNTTRQLNNEQTVGYVSEHFR
jgi:hypothetical protein